MKVHQLADGQWEFDSGEIQGTRIRRLFATKAQAEALLRKTQKEVKTKGEQFALDWLCIQPDEAARILDYRKAVMDLGGKVDWQKGKELHYSHLSIEGMFSTPLALDIGFRNQLQKGFVEQSFGVQCQRVSHSLFC